MNSSGLITNSVAEERIAWVDTMKAFLIISVVIGHSTSPLVTYIYLFHMPAFFMLAGYTYRGDKMKIGAFLKKDAHYFSSCCADKFDLCINIFHRTDGGWLSVISNEAQMGLKERIVALVGNLQTTDLGASWFLFVFFETEILVIFAGVRRNEKLFETLVFMVGNRVFSG